LDAEGRDELDEDEDEEERPSEGMDGNGLFFLLKRGVSFSDICESRVLFMVEIFAREDWLSLESEFDSASEFESESESESESGSCSESEPDCE
jgi:hypothetical protein